MIIFINGSVNAGKTTVAKKLSEKLPNVALVEIDVLRDMIEWMPIDEAVPINLENAVSVIRNFAKRGLNIVAPYPLSQNNYNYMMDYLKDIDTKIYVFTLAPKLEKILTNRGNRKLNDWERKRIKHHYNLGIHSPSFGEMIDNTDKTPDQTVEQILVKLKT